MLPNLLSVNELEAAGYAAHCIRILSFGKTKLTLENQMSGGRPTALYKFRSPNGSLRATTRTLCTTELFNQGVDGSIPSGLTNYLKRLARSDRERLSKA